MNIMKIYKILLLLLLVLMLSACGAAEKEAESPLTNCQSLIGESESAAAESEPAAAEEETEGIEETEEEVQNGETESSGWAGKTCIMFGDSIVRYDGQNAYTGDMEVLHGYESYLRDYGFSVVENMGENGGCIADHSPESSCTDIITVVMDTDTSGYDLIIIAGGVNDYMFFSSPMGELSDGNYDTGSFYGAYQTIIEKIMTENPDGVLALFTPIPCRGCKEENQYGLTLADYAEAIRQVGAYYEIPVLDLYEYEGFTESDLDILTMDGIHPNNDGYRLISEDAILPFVEGL